MALLRAPVLVAGLAAVLVLLTGCVPAEETTPSPSSTAAVPDPSEGATSLPVPSQSPKATKKKDGKTPDAREDHTDPASIGVVVNKRRPLAPLDYHPDDLRQPAVSIGTGGESALLRDAVADATEKMFSAAAADGAPMIMVSGFRSYATQVDTYNHWVLQHGSEAAADMISARPGYSEHQTGLSMDIGDITGACNLQQCFADTAAGTWAARNAVRFGFIIRYSPGEEKVTGYSPEPWHLRYVGKKVAGKMEERGIGSLEEYFGLPAAPDYS
ncbi:D-alanyl-D-alanine carboxypeptidase family protein [Arthrobacter sp. CAU 1506]|uniref:M15 family metallopeptidase n=1 Tax=Arthrobacter sp. CAU 1506 TaxID=2560052 RepID=UPI0010AD4E66|nr:M15 family metallopeptidase [Arthrobacter sp. CAU 1506]TJY71478.1 D-alanyl-D-alanine carboxypeptidase family protein [Arthrobacter sp. CAU 1506]